MSNGTPPLTQDGGEKREPTSIRAGRQLQGRYNLVNRIAKGGMGEVWRARDIRTGTMVAAKVLRPELTGEEISLSRLRIEAKNAMKARHPNIAAVLDSGESEGQGWIVMELVQGDPLTDFVGDGKRLSPAELIPLLSQTAFALDGAAQAGIVHRDIKPANIMIRHDGMVKLTDFGISYAAGQANLTAVGMVMGTAQYLAPEQAMGSVATHSGDLYSLGIIAYEALAGYRPFTGKSVVDIAMSHVNDQVPELPADVPQPLADAVYQLLEKDPANRPPSGTALVRSLRKVADQIGVSTDPMPLAKPVPEGNDTSGTARTSQRTPEAGNQEDVVHGVSGSPALPRRRPTSAKARRGGDGAPGNNAAAGVPRNSGAPKWKATTEVQGAGAASGEAATARPLAAREIPAGADRAEQASPVRRTPGNAAAGSARRAPRASSQSRSSAGWVGPADGPQAGGNPGASGIHRSWRPVRAEAGTRVTSPDLSRRGIPERRVPPSRSARAGSPTRADAGSGSGSGRVDVGLWVIVALVALTIVLIVVAMLRDKAPQTPDQAFGPMMPEYIAELEVPPWLTPTHVF